MAATAEANTIAFKLGDREYNLSKLDLNELVELEEVMGKPFPEIDYSEMKAMRFVIYLIRRRKDPEITLAAVGAEITVEDMSAAELADVQDAAAAAAGNGGTASDRPPKPESPVPTAGEGAPESPSS